MVLGENHGGGGSDALPMSASNPDKPPSVPEGTVAWPSRSARGHPRGRQGPRRRQKFILLHDFSSTRKRGSVGEADGQGYVLYTKGADVVSHGHHASCMGGQESVLDLACISLCACFTNDVFELTVLFISIIDILHALKMLFEYSSNR